ncbi:dipeptidase [Thermomicrobium sp. 4228-Ro]|uniref:dipeptidase n=1 Tax=Thermomicrobium sp. 4228-Ro TaxID=2993937 RepID=UPI0022495E02|nr:dipeptidase [Thermomicrobium sp. 4228-Ro]MCX2727659.1 dipeptidase [Thermomicrobium sp. 4228-Ro]
MIPIIDGHTDYLLSLLETGRDFLTESDCGHVDLPRARRGHLAAMFSAVFIRDAYLPDQALLRTMRAVDRLLQTIAASGGAMQLVTTVSELEHCLRTGTFGAILHFEGAEAIDPEFAVLRLAYRLGLRSLGLTWSRPNIYAEGVGPDDRGRGLTDLGRALVRACNELGVLIDVSHLNDAGFWDVIERSTQPVVASHSNCRALCPVPRNLTDEQIRALAAKGGLLGINFHVGFLRPGAERPDEVSLGDVIAHIDHVAELVGIDYVAFGSDFDGATMPHDLPDAAAMPRLVEALSRHGYDDVAVRKICYENWLRVLRTVWRA